MFTIFFKSLLICRKGKIEKFAHCKRKKENKKGTENKKTIKKNKNKNRTKLFEQTRKEGKRKK